MIDCDIELLPVEEISRIEIDYHGCIEFNKIKNYYNEKDDVQFEHVLESFNDEYVDTCTSSSIYHSTLEDQEIVKNWKSIEYVICYCLFKNKNLFRILIKKYAKSMLEVLKQKRRETLKITASQRADNVNRHVYLCLIPKIEKIYSDPRHTSRDIHEVEYFTQVEDMYELYDILPKIKKIVMYELGDNIKKQYDNMCKNKEEIYLLELAVSSIYNNSLIQRKIVNFNKKDQRIYYSLSNCLVNYIIYYIKSKLD